MKTTLLTYLCSFALVLTAFGQTPTPPASPTATAVTSTSTTATVAPTVTPYEEDSIEREVARKLKRKFGVTIDTKGVTNVSRHSRDWDDDDDFGAFMAIPIIGIIAGTWYKIEQTKSVNNLKRKMVERGMSADEIERVIKAGPPADE